MQYDESDNQGDSTMKRIITAVAVLTLLAGCATLKDAGNSVGSIFSGKPPEVVMSKLPDRVASNEPFRITITAERADSCMLDTSPPVQGITKLVLDPKSAKADGAKSVWSPFIKFATPYAVTFTVTCTNRAGSTTAPSQRVDVGAPMKSQDQIAYEAAMAKYKTDLAEWERYEAERGKMLTVPRTIPDPKCKDGTRVVPTGETQLIPFVSLGCSNVIVDPKYSKKGDAIINNGGKPFSGCSVFTKEDYLALWGSSDPKCRPLVGMQRIAEILEQSGIPVQPSAEGYRSFVLSDKVVASEVTHQLLETYQMARANKEGKVDLSHQREEPYLYAGGKKELALFYKKPIYKTEKCPDVQNPAWRDMPPRAKPQEPKMVQAAVAPAIAVSSTPNACPRETRTFRLHLFDESKSSKIEACRAQAAPLHVGDSNAFSRAPCILDVLKSEPPLTREWHATGKGKAVVSTVGPDGSVIAMLRDVALENGYASVEVPYTVVANKRVKVDFTAPQGGRWVASHLANVFIEPREFESPVCAYDVSAPIVFR